MYKMQPYPGRLRLALAPTLALALAPTLALLLTATSTAAQAVENQLDWSARTRYLDQAGDQSGRAMSALLRATLSSQWSDRLSTQLELDHVSTGFKDHHSDGVRFNNQPFIPDPPGSEINQALVDLKLESLELKLGRQRINFDDQRIIGGNAFWQNEQTFDALVARAPLHNNSSLSYAYIANANRIFGDDAKENGGDSAGRYGGADNERPAALYGDHKQHTQLLRLEWNEWDYTRLVAYGLHIDNLDMPSVSGDTLGLNYSFNIKSGAIKYRLQLNTAIQQPARPHNDLRLPYYLGELGLGYGAVEFSGRYEILGAKDGVAFSTPLGSVHDFEGWADQANQLGDTGAGGIRNASLGLLWRAAPFRAELHYHDFASDADGQAIGRELDLKLSYRPSRKHQLSLVFAGFEPDASRRDSGELRRVYLDYAYNL